MFFQNFSETRKRYYFVDHTKPLHTNHTVQWLSQSIALICISALVAMLIAAGYLTLKGLRGLPLTSKIVWR